MIIDNFLGPKLSLVFWISLELALLYCLYKLGSKLIDLYFDFQEEQEREETNAKG